MDGVNQLAEAQSIWQSSEPRRSKSWIQSRLEHNGPKSPRRGENRPIVFESALYGKDEAERLTWTCRGSPWPWWGTPGRCCSPPCREPWPTRSTCPGTQGQTSVTIGNTPKTSQCSTTTHHMAAVTLFVQAGVDVVREGVRPAELCAVATHFSHFCRQKRAARITLTFLHSNIYHYQLYVRLFMHYYAHY